MLCVSNSDTCDPQISELSRCAKWQGQLFGVGNVNDGGRSSCEGLDFKCSGCPDCGGRSCICFWFWRLSLFVFWRMLEACTAPWLLTHYTSCWQCELPQGATSLTVYSNRPSCASQIIKNACTKTLQLADAAETRALEAELTAAYQNHPEGIWKHLISKGFRFAESIGSSHKTDWTLLFENCRFASVEWFPCSSIVQARQLCSLDVGNAQLGRGVGRHLHKALEYVNKFWEEAFCTTLDVSRFNNGWIYARATSSTCAARLMSDVE